MKVSVITTSYNSVSTLRDTMESVLRQTYGDIEYIIVDGASTDGTVPLIESYVPRFGGRMRYVSEPDGGIYEAMNKGLTMATGDVVGLLNSDDFYTSDDAVATLVAELERTGADAVYADVHFVNGDDLTKCVRYYSSAVFRRGLMRLGFMPAHPSFYARRKVYEDYGGFDPSFRVAADFENLLRSIFVHHIKTAYVRKDVVTMRTGGMSTAGFASRKTIMSDHLRALRKNGVYSNFFILSLRYVYKLYEMWFMKNPAGN